MSKRVTPAPRAPKVLPRIAKVIPLNPPVFMCRIDEFGRGKGMVVRVTRRQPRRGGR